MLFFIYSRKSIYTGKGDSTENQLEMSRQYIFSKFPNTAETDITIYEDEGFSGKNMERPGFQRMLKDIRIKRPDCIVCYRLDRISRSVSDFSALIEELNHRNICFICIKEEFDTSKPMGKAMMYIASVFAQLERETLAERVRDNMLMLARTGRWLGGTLPTGFTSEKIQEIVIDGRLKTSCMLKPNALELPTVALMYEKFWELHSLSGVSKYLIRENIRSRSGKYYSVLGIKDILQNPVYCTADRDALAYFTANNADVCFEDKDCSDTAGLLSYNKRDYTKKSAPRQPMEKWIIAIGKHPGLISGKRWAATQSLLGAAKAGGSGHKAHNDYALLSGLIICKDCQERMYAKSHRNRKENGSFYYMCQSKLRGGTTLCRGSNLNGLQTDQAVYESLLPYIKEGSGIQDKLEILKGELQKESSGAPEETIRVRIQECRDEIDHFIHMLSQPELSDFLLRTIDDKVAFLGEELSELEEKLKLFRQDQTASSESDILKKQLTDKLCSLKQASVHFSVAEKRTLIRLLVRKIQWDGSALHIFIAGK